MAVDEAASRRAISRSAFLEATAGRELVRRDSDEVAQAIERSERRFEHAGAFEAAEVIRRDRDGRASPDVADRSTTTHEVRG